MTVVVSLKASNSVATSGDFRPAKTPVDERKRVYIAFCAQNQRYVYLKLNKMINAQQYHRNTKLECLATAYSSSSSSSSRNSVFVAEYLRRQWLPVALMNSDSISSNISALCQYKNVTYCLLTLHLLT